MFMIRIICDQNDRFEYSIYKRKIFLKWPVMWSDDLDIKIWSNLENNLLSHLFMQNIYSPKYPVNYPTRSGENLCCSGLNWIDKNFSEFCEDKTGHWGVSKPVWSGFGLDAAEQNAWKHPLNLYDECLSSF